MNSRINEDGTASELVAHRWGRHIQAIIFQLDMYCNRLVSSELLFTNRVIYLAFEVEEGRLFIFLTRVRWNLSVILICISFMAKDIGHSFQPFVLLLRTVSSIHLPIY
jgi:hypothetical protein